jgi:hypothetical protein
MAFGASDKNRTNFLSGFKNTPLGGFEDPTYLGFKIIFDIDGVLPIGSDDGLPPSPLFKDTSYNSDSASKNPFGLPASFLSNTNINFYSAQSYLLEREQRMNLGEGGKRADILKQFKTLLDQINKQSPWFFQSIEGLDQLAKVEKKGYDGTDSTGFNSNRTAGRAIDINCLESINLRVSTLADLYRQATFDFDYMREVVPRNLLKFKMWIFVSEIRSFQKTNRLTGISTAIKALDGTANLLTNGMNPGNSIGPDGNNVGGLDLNASGSSRSTDSVVGGILNKTGLGDLASGIVNQSDQSGVTPILVYECSQCEFDFDSTTPIKPSLENGSGSATPEAAKFRIYVGKVRTRNQYPNIRNDKNFLILADGFDQNRTSVIATNRKADGLGTNPGEGGNALAGFLDSQAGKVLTNFVGNSVNDYVNSQTDKLNGLISGVNQNILGNAYSFNPGALIARPSFNSVSDLSQQLNNGLNLGQIFQGQKLPNPQTTGLGGPPERVYTRPTGDVYANVPGKDLGVVQRVYEKPTGDVYPNVPGKDLGVPQRVYGTPKSDVYPNVPGKDLGGTDRIYNQPIGDFYPDSPGKDLGVPDRIYPSTEGDVYPDVPGKDLGPSERVYNSPEGDVYPDVPGKDLGPSERVYNSPEGDVYLNVPGKDLGVPDRAYRLENSDVYATSPGRDLGVPERNYDGLGNQRVYSPSTEQNPNTIAGRLYTTDFQPEPTNLSKVYPGESLANISGDSNLFSSPPAPVYAPPVPTREGNSPNIGKLYPTVTGDFQPEIQTLGNVKGPDRYNFSLGDTNKEFKED